MSLSVLFVWPSMYRGVYGRFLLSQLDTAGNVAVLNVALAFVGLAGRVASRPEAGALLSKMYSDRAAAGAEPSTPAFRLPFQDITSSNHIAQWADQVIPIQ